MGFYRALWNVKDSTGADIAPGGLANLKEADAVKLAAVGSIEPVAVLGETVLGPDDRLTALSAFFPNLMLGDMTGAGTLRVDARRRVIGQLGFEATDDEIRAAIEAAKAKAAGA